MEYTNMMFQNKNEDPTCCGWLESTAIMTEHITHNHFKETYYRGENEMTQQSEIR